MELDDLKKSWGVLDNRLKKNKLIDEQALSKLINERTKQTRSSMDKILLYAKIALILGFFLTIGLGYYLLTTNNYTRDYCLWLYMWIMLCIGMVWDGTGYFYLKSINIEEMPLVTVVKKITAYHRNFIIECYVAAVFFLSAVLIQAVCINLMELDLVAKLTFVIVWVVGCFAAIWIIKKLYYNKLKDIKKNLAELRELKQD